VAGIRKDQVQMPRFAANVTTMFHEMEIPERFAAARQCGFTAVEFLHPYEWQINEIRQWLDATGLSIILINTPTGEGEVGLAALPGREDEFQAVFGQTLEYAVSLNVPMIHLLAGRSSERQTASEDRFIENTVWAADLAGASGITLLLEPLNTRDVPGYLHTHCDHTAQLIEQIDRSNVKMQFDFYHSQIMGGDLAASITRHLESIGHVQFSSVPGRHEPQYGEVNVDPLFDHLDNLGYDGWIGCEYIAKGDTREGLSWARAWGLG
jgi:hydroxypyruvate isomerase